jgi:hypothetical protein
MNAVSEENNKLSAERIALQNSFKEYNEANGFSYEDWINPAADHFYADYKAKLDAINEKMAPALQYQQ